MKPKLRYVLCDVGSYILCPELLRAKARGVGGGIDEMGTRGLGSLGG